MIQTVSWLPGIPEALLVAVGVADRQVISKSEEACREAFIAMENCPNQWSICSMPRYRRFSHRGDLRANRAICQILPFQRPVSYAAV